MEDLNKNQIILLTILISFVTSIATGIMTVSLLIEAPVEVTNTINRVVEKTIETVTPEIVNNSKQTKEVVTVVVSEDDKVVSAIEKNSLSVVRIRARNKELGVDNFYGMGLIVNKDGLIVTDKKIVSEVMDYVAITSTGFEMPLVSVSANKRSDVGFFLAKPKEKYNFVPIALSSVDPKLGQSVVVIGGDSVNAISTGKITTVNTLETSTTTKIITSIETDVSSKDLVYGGPLLSLSGEVLGMSLSDFSSLKVFIPSYVIKREASLIKIN
jgi:S1-C subfamily serine protease